MVKCKIKERKRERMNIYTRNRAGRTFLVFPENFKRRAVSTRVGSSKSNTFGQRGRGNGGKMWDLCLTNGRHEVEVVKKD